MSDDAVSAGPPAPGGWSGPRNTGAATPRDRLWVDDDTRELLTDAGFPGRMGRRSLAYSLRRPGFIAPIAVAVLLFAVLGIAGALSSSPALAVIGFGAALLFVLVLPLSALLGIARLRRMVPTGARFALTFTPEAFEVLSPFGRDHLRYSAVSDATIASGLSLIRLQERRRWVQLPHELLSGGALERLQAAIRSGVDADSLARAEADLERAAAEPSPGPESDPAADPLSGLRSAAAAGYPEPTTANPAPSPADPAPSPVSPAAARASSAAWTAPATAPAASGDRPIPGPVTSPRPFGAGGSRQERYPERHLVSDGSLAWRAAGVAARRTFRTPLIWIVLAVGLLIVALEFLAFRQLDIVFLLLYTVAALLFVVGLQARAGYRALSPGRRWTSQLKDDALRIASDSTSTELPLGQIDRVRETSGFLLIRTRTGAWRLLPIELVGAEESARLLELTRTA